MNVRCWFPNLDEQQLVDKVAFHAIRLGYDPVNAAQAVVNFLRHECTDYDAHQSTDRHRDACQAIAVRYPWLAEECARQITARQAADAEADALFRALEQEAAEQKAYRQQVAADSRTAIAAFTVGQQVAVKVKGHQRHGTVIKVGRSKVTVAYQIATGRDRDRQVTIHAALVTSAKDGGA